MDKFREFEGKDLDACIRDACEYFNAPREKLEIEIIQDAKSGIFGIVLARKAKIRARRAQFADAVQDILKQSARPAVESSVKIENASASQQATPAKVPPAKVHRENSREKKSENVHSAQKPVVKPNRQADPVLPAKEESAKTSDEQIPFQKIESREEIALDYADAGKPLKQPEELDKHELEARAVKIVSGLVRPLAGRDVSVEASVDHGSVHARVAWQGDAGLLIGREGQTLAALQYLASRMLSRAFNSALRVQLDIGEYRSRQDEKLRSLALSLAEKVRHSGRSFSTRPLSSYHRRIIHLALQEQADLLTRSSGDGPMKRVIVSMRKTAEK